MTKLEQLFDVLSSPTYRALYQSAKASRKCLLCGHPVGAFTDEWSRIEYEVSAICQNCQGEYFKGK